MEPTREELLAALERQRLEIERLQARVDELTRALEEALRRGKRQAAPFGKDAPKPDPKPPGRKAGDRHGQHGRRPPLADDQIDEHLDASLPAACPHCGGGVVETHQDTQDQVELPARPLRRRFHIHCGHCRACGQRLRGRHAQQTSAATGAAASQVGPQAQALVVYLNKQAGLSHGKTAAVLTLLGIPLTRGASAQIILRAGRRLQPTYEALLQALPDQEHLTPDETGWRVGGQAVWLHAWVGIDLTVFAIDPHRSAEPLARVIGWDWEGDLTHDGAPSYDRFVFARHQQCVFHVLHRAHDLEEVQAGRAKAFPRQVITLFQGALQVRDQFLAGDLDEAGLRAAHARYVEELFALAERPRANAANDRLARHLYHYGEQWLTFLEDPAVPATNHRAEQALKVPIVNRKVWGGNRTQAGAQAQTVLQSTLATCKQQAVSFLHFLGDCLCGIPRALLGGAAAEPVLAGR
jgi:transposase